MRHNRTEVIERTVREFEDLDQLVSTLTDDQWDLPLGRPEGKDPWTVKDALAHITYWKAGVARTIRHQHKPPEERGLKLNETNHLVYKRWHDRTPQEILAWHRQVQQDVMIALNEAPDEWFSRREHNEDWPGDLVSHSAHHRIRDIERVVNL